MTVITGSPIHSMPPLLREMAERSGLSSKQHAENTERGSPRWYEELIRYALEARSEQHGWWQIVEDSYRQRRQTERPEGWHEQLSEVVKGRVYSQVHATEAMGLNRRPKFALRGTTGEWDKDVAPVLEKTINREWQEDHALNKQVRLCYRDSCKLGIGVAQTAFYMGRRRRRRRSPAVGIDGALAEDFRSQLEVAEGLPEFEEERETWEQDSRKILRRPVTFRVSPWDFFIDPDATCFEDARYMGRILYDDIEAIRAYKGFDSADKVEPNRSAFDGIGRDMKIGKERRRSRLVSPYEDVVLAEIFERMPGGHWRYIVLPLNHDFFLIEDEDLYWTGTPYRVLTWNDDGECIYPKSDIAQVWSEILAERILFTKVVQGLAARSEDTLIVDERAGIEKDKLQVINHPEFGKIITLKTSLQDGGRVSDLFGQVTRQNDAQALVGVLSYMDSQFLIGAGFGENQIGMAMRSGTTAHESQNVRESVSARQSHKVDATEAFLEQIAYDRLARNAQFNRGDEGWARTIMSPEDAAIWAQIEWTKAMVQGGMRVSIHSGSTRPFNQETRTQSALTYLGIVNQDSIMRANTDVIGLQKVIHRGLELVDGSYILEDDPKRFAELQRQRAEAELAGQGGSAGRPSPTGAPAMAASDAGATQLAQGR